MNRVQDITETTWLKASDGSQLEVGPLLPARLEELFWLFTDIVARYEGFPQLPPLTRAVFEETWVRPVTVVVGALREGQLAGAYYLKPNQPGLGAHIANAGYVVARGLRGLGIGRALVEDSVPRASVAGYDALQFNFVFADNPARSLYEELGWREIGRVPQGAGPGRDALIYWRSLR